MRPSRDCPDDVIVRAMLPWSALSSVFPNKFPSPMMAFERRPQFVTDACDEQAFCAARRFGLALRFRQLRDQSRDVKRQHHEPREEARAHGQMGAPELADRDYGPESHHCHEGCGEEVFDPEAEAVAENDPEIDRVERRHGFATGGDAVGESPRSRTMAKSLRAVTETPGR